MEIWASPIDHRSVHPRSERDSNPRYLSVHTISNRAPSATRSPLQRGFFMELRRRRDLNPRCLRKSDFESDTIGHSDTPPELVFRPAPELGKERLELLRALDVA